MSVDLVMAGLVSSSADEAAAVSSVSPRIKKNLDGEAFQRMLLYAKEEAISTKENQKPLRDKTAKAKPETMPDLDELLYWAQSLFMAEQAEWAEETGANGRAKTVDEITTALRMLLHGIHEQNTEVEGFFGAIEMSSAKNLRENTSANEVKRVGLKAGELAEENASFSGTGGTSSSIEELERFFLELLNALAEHESAGSSPSPTQKTLQDDLAKVLGKGSMSMDGARVSHVVTPRTLTNVEQALLGLPEEQPWEEGFLAEYSFPRVLAAGSSSTGKKPVISGQMRQLPNAYNRSRGGLGQDPANPFPKKPTVTAAGSVVERLNIAPKGGQDLSHDLEPMDASLKMGDSTPIVPWGTMAGGEKSPISPFMIPAENTGFFDLESQKASLTDGGTLDLPKADVVEVVETNSVLYAFGTAEQGNIGEPDAELHFNSALYETTAREKDTHIPGEAAAESVLGTDEEINEIGLEKDVRIENAPQPNPQILRVELPSDKPLSAEAFEDESKTFETAQTKRLDSDVEFPVNDDAKNIVPEKSTEGMESNDKKDNDAVLQDTRLSETAAGGPLHDVGEGTAKASHIDQTGRPELNRPQMPVSPGQVVEQIIQKAQLDSTGEYGEVRLQLKPEHLGELQMKIATNNGVVSALFIAESHTVKSLIESGLPDLKEQLMQHGLNIQDVAVHVGSDPSSNGQAHSGHSRFDWPGSLGVRGASQSTKVQVSHTPQRGWGSSIDFRA
ncbi:MAG: flagellar hook-length control protein FliK [Firmicutes bacterium]|nr:flagellar hook-length control protein FliK [Bacillota bacterium]